MWRPTTLAGELEDAAAAAASQQAPHTPAPAPHPQPKPPADSPFLRCYHAHIPISAADACRSAPQAPAGTQQLPDIISGARAFMAAAAARRGVPVHRVCWWFQSGYEVAEGGEKLAWGTAVTTGTCTGAFAAFFMLNVLECALITEAREAAAGSGTCGTHGTPSRAST